MKYIKVASGSGVTSNSGGMEAGGASAVRIMKNNST